MDTKDNSWSLKTDGFSEEALRVMNRKRFCPRCGRELKYDALGEYYCPVCGHKELNDYGKVRKFLDENGSSPAPVIEAATGVPMVVINELLDIGKVQIPNGSSDFLKCQQCGRNIKFGRICPDCAQNMTAGLKGAFKDSVGELAPRQNRPKSVTAERKPRMYTAGMRWKK